MPSAPAALEAVLSLSPSAEEELLGQGHAACMARIRALGPRLGDALDWAAEHDPERGLCLAASVWRYWVASLELLQEGRQQLGWLLSLVPSPSPTRLAGLTSSALLASFSGAHEEAWATATRALPLARALDDEVRLAYLELVVGRAAQAKGDVRGASAHFEEALERFRDSQQAFGAATALLGLASSRRTEGHPEAAARLLGESQGLLEASGASLESSDRLVFEREEGALRAALGAAYEGEWRRGQEAAADSAR